MKFNSMSTRSNIEYDFIYLGAYKGWDDIVGRELYQLAERARSYAGRNLNLILLKLDECECNFEEDLCQLEEKIQRYR